MAKKILVVDDEPNIVKVLVSRLKANGYDVITASDGDDGLAKARAERPDLIILDLIMPKMNGYRMSSLLREDEGCKDIPIIVLSAWVRNKAGEDVSVAEVYIKKPFEAETLLDNIKSLLGQM